MDSSKDVTEFTGTGTEFAMDGSVFYLKKKQHFVWITSGNSRVLKALVAIIPDRLALLLR